MITINLLPWREEVRKQKKIHTAFIASGFILFPLFLILLLHFHIHWQIKAQQKRNTFLTSTITHEKSRVAELNKEKKEVSDIRSQIFFIISLLNTSYEAIKILDNLPRIIPDDVILTSLTRDKNHVTLVGQSASHVQITYLMQNIAKSFIFKNPELTQISEKIEVEGSERQFQLTMELQG